MSSPPGSSSSFWTSTAKPSGAHQDPIPAGVVHSSQRVCAEASKVRSMRILSAAPGGGWSVTADAPTSQWADEVDTLLLRGRFAHRGHADARDHLGAGRAAGYLDAGAPAVLRGASRRAAPAVDARAARARGDVRRLPAAA